jgi:acyl carrier protein
MDILKLLFDSIDEMNLDLDPKEKIVKDENTVVFGKDSSLDSIGLVNFITIIEEHLENETGNFVTIADERALSLEDSPFKTIGTLKNYIEVLLNEQQIN